jgi:cytochrome b561
VSTAADADSAGAHDDEKDGAPGDGKDRARSDAGRVAAHPPRAVRGVARLGLVARAGFYLLLAGLAVNLLIGVGSGQVGGQAGGHASGQTSGQAGGQANANGALTQVAHAPVGFGLLAAAALGFTVFGVVRIAGAIADGQHGRLRRVSTAGQGLLYLAMGAATTSFLLGSRGTGSEQQQRSTAAKVIGLPFGRALLAVVGLVVLGMCAWQVVVAVQGHYADSLKHEEMGRRTRGLTKLTARIGIPARALAVAPVGLFLLVAAARADPEQAKGLDALLLEASRNPVGRVLVALAAAGFVVFAVYSLLEARYRQVSSGA